MTLREKVAMVAARHRSRWYFYYIMRILLELDPDEWVTGDAICDVFDQECRDGEIRNKRDGRPRKGFDYQTLIREVEGYPKGFAIECTEPPPHQYWEMYPWYKNQRFRIHPDWREAVEAFYKDWKGR